MMSGLAVIVRPAMNSWQFTRPVTVNMLHASCPLQCIGSPWVLRSTFTPPDGSEEIPQERHLSKSGNNSCPGNEYIYRKPFLHERKLRKSIVPAGHSVNP